MPKIRHNYIVVLEEFAKKLDDLHSFPMFSFKTIADYCHLYQSSIDWSDRDFLHGAETGSDWQIRRSCLAFHWPQKMLKVCLKAPQSWFVPARLVFEGECSTQGSTHGMHGTHETQGTGWSSQLPGVPKNAKGRQKATSHHLCHGQSWVDSAPSPEGLVILFNILRM